MKAATMMSSSAFWCFFGGRWFCIWRKELTLARMKNKLQSVTILAFTWTVKLNPKPARSNTFLKHTCLSALHHCSFSCSGCWPFYILFLFLLCRDLLQVATEGTADFGTFALPYFSFVWGYSLLLALWSFGSFWICAKGHEGRAAQICLCAVYQGDQAAHTPVFCHTAPRGR